MVEIMSKISWTSEQEAAIGFSAKANLLVSAAAGSGKTAVLAERIITRAIAGDVDLSRVLVMTFTDLAAKQMKNRIEARLLEARADADTAAEMAHLDALLRIFPQTHISTIHSFCNRLLGDYLAEFKDDRGEPLLEPGYSLLDEEAAAGLLDEVLTDLLARQYALLDDSRYGRLPADWPDEYYRKIDVLLPAADPLDYLADFDRLSKAYAPGLSDENLREALKQCLGKLRSLPDYRNLVRQSLNNFVAELESFPAQELLDHFFSIYFEHFNRMKAGLRLLEEHPHYERVRNAAKESPGIQRQQELMDHARRLLEVLGDISAATVENFQRISEAGRELDGISMPGKVGGKGSEKTINHNDFVDLMSSTLMPFFYLINDNNKISSQKQQEYFPDTEALFTVSLQEMQEDLKISVGPAARFFELVLALDKEFQKEKFSRNLLEFADFEHGAFQLLQEEAIRREVQYRYDEIYIDEYQDTSSIQDGIVSAIARDNIFMVGDVKQSIYRFRYANPALFQYRADKAEFFSGSADSGVKDYLLNLSTNFRSQSKIIDFVNEIFSSLLTREAAEIEYDESQRLYVRPGTTEPGQVSWRILTNTGEDLPESSGSENDFPLKALGFTPANEFQRLSLLAADTIRSLQDEGTELKDIALLCCTNAQCKSLRDSLEKQGIPVTGSFGGIYPENLIMRQFEALLNVLDNPRQDIPLATYLASPLSGDPLSPEEFIRIRPLAEQKFSAGEKPGLRYFHERVMLIEDFSSCADKRDEKIRLKLKQAMERIRHWRLLARERSNRDLLSLILQETQFEKLLEQSDGSLSSLRDSRRRLTELKQFLDFVKESSFQGFDSVQKLLQRLEKLRQRDIFPDDSDLQSDLDAVRVLTYHKSKGLQWRCVILLGLGNKQVRSDNDLISIDEHDGIRSYSFSADGLSVADNFLNRKKKKNEEERERAEAWRQLYVGMTRAQDRLFLISEYRKLPADDSFLKANAAAIDAGPRQYRKTGEALLPAELVRKANSYADILWSVLLLRYPEETMQLLSSEAASCELPHISLETIPYADIFEKSCLRAQTAEKNPELTDDMLLLSDSAFDSESTPWDVQDLVALLSADLPYQAAAAAPAKLTVSELKRAADRESLLVEKEEPEHRQAVLSFESWISQHDKPEGRQPEEIALTLRRAEADGSTPTAAEQGTHLYSFLCFLDLGSLVNKAEDERIAELGRQLEQMIAKLQLPAEARATIKAKEQNILAYAGSTLAGRVLAAEKNGRVYREMPFTLAVPAAELGQDYPADELTLVQGMIDLWFVEADNQVVLIDFKSDRLPSDPRSQDEMMRQRYALQLAYYARAIERATGRKVKEKLIWLLQAERSLQLED